MKIIFHPLFYLTSILYLLSYSEKPFGFLVLILLLTKGKYKSILLSLPVVLIDSACQYMVYETLMPRFLQNLYTLTILLAIIIEKKIEIKSKHLKNLYYIFITIGIIRLIDNANGDPAFFFLNENLIGIAIFSTMIVIGFKLIGALIIAGLSVKGITILSLLLCVSIIKLIVAIAGILILKEFGFGVISEYINDLALNTLSSGRIELWQLILSNYQPFDNYEKLLNNQLTNTESFFINQIFSFPFVWPIIWMLTIYAITRGFSSNLIRASILIVFIIYPYPHFILFLGIFKVIKEKIR